MITNEQGQVAVQYYQTTPHVVDFGKTQYAFVVRANICMAWIDPGHVEQILNLVKVCCGGYTKKKYLLANESSVRRWTNGGGA